MRTYLNFIDIRHLNIFIFILLMSLSLNILAKENLAQISIINQSTGEELKTYKYKGELWVAGNPSERYSIKINNPNNERILSVISVDGVNVISGKTAALNQTGYVVGPNDSMEISGWRKSNQEVARFYFTSVNDSYASKTNRPNNIGIIGVALFKEYKPPVSVAAIYKDKFNTFSLNIKRKAMNQKLGTGHGERMNSPSINTSFKKMSTIPQQIITIRYDSLNNLQSMGIAPRQLHIPIPAKPQAFPGQDFVPNPN